MFDIYSLAASLIGGVLLTLVANAASMKPLSALKTLRGTLSSFTVSIRHPFVVMVRLMIKH
jgi:hypothetical protein